MGKQSFVMAIIGSRAGSAFSRHRAGGVAAMTKTTKTA
jgi:hypothetical protein